MRLLRRRMLVAGMGGALTYLLRDEFATAAGAPLTSPRTCAPGPGTLTITDTGNNLSIGGGKLLGRGIAGAGDPKVMTAAFDRVAGRLFSFLWTYNTNRGGGGWYNNVLPTANPNLGIMDVSGNETTIPPGSTGGDALAIGTEYTVAAILRGTGGFVLLKSGAYTEWTLSFVGNLLTLTPMYAGAWARAADFDIDTDSWRIADLPAPWTTDNGIATTVLAGARSAGDTFTHEANCLIEFTQTTVPAALQTELRFRIQDATNYWQVTVDSTGALDLDEVVAGSATQRGTSAGVIANGDRIVIIADGTTIKVFEANTLRITYTSAANFATETAGKRNDSVGTEGGTVTDLIAWPRTLSGTALSTLEEYTA